MSRPLIYTILAMCTALVVGGSFSNVAAAATVKSPSCDLSAALAQLSALHTTNTKRELTIRRDLLKQTITCGIREVDALSDALSSSPVSDRRTADLKTSFRQSLADVRAHYEARTRDVDAATTIAATKSLARDLRTWRERTYLPLAFEADQFVGASRNTALIDAADARLSQLETIATTASLLTEQPDLKEHLVAARAAVAEARAQHDELFAAFQQTPRRTPAEILRITTEALSSLSDAYDAFLRASASITGAERPQ